MPASVSQLIELRLVSEEDAQLLFDLMTGKNWLHQIGDRGIRNLEDCKKYILDRMHSDLQVKGFVNYVIIDRGTRAEVGTCSLHDREGVDGLDIGYAILQAQEGKGYATVAARQMVSLAFNSYQEDKVSAITTDGNRGSCRVLEKIGFKHKGYVQLPNGLQELRLYVLFKKDWK